MSDPINVVVVGATGQTGSLIINGLLESETRFNIRAFTRPSSVGSVANEALLKRGVAVTPADLKGPKESLVELLRDVEIVICAIYHEALLHQIPLATAAKEAGVKRFVPCNFGTPGIRGIVWANDTKLDVFDAIQTLFLPYTIIDVGWWSDQAISVARLPSGRTDWFLVPHVEYIPGDGSVKGAFTSTKDIGKYVAKIITDPRTLNSRVFAYTDVMSYNEIADMVDDLSGEKCNRKYLSAKDIDRNIEEGKAAYAQDPSNFSSAFKVIMNQYYSSYGIRGDNSPVAAKYLGYLDFKELYPEEAGEGMRSVIQRALAETVTERRGKTKAASFTQL